MRLVAVRRRPDPNSGSVMDSNLLAVYGTLRRRSIFDKLPVAVSQLQFVSCGRVRGRLLWQRTYPALIWGCGVVEVEIFRVVDPGVWRDLDLYEGFKAINPAASLFIRRQVLLLNPRTWSWVYFLNPQIPRGRKISPQSRLSRRPPTQRTSPLWRGTRKRRHVPGGGRSIGTITS
jgi:gamma-glutamylcyclotransferase (GGCT)/AIG2-like uncharacterized protein YtfP